MLLILKMNQNPFTKILKFYGGGKISSLFVLVLFSPAFSREYFSSCETECGVTIPITKNVLLIEIIDSLVIYQCRQNIEKLSLSSYNVGARDMTQ